VYTIAPGEAQPSDGWTEWTPRGGLEFQVTDDVMTYVSVSRGFKSGGFNGRPSAVAVAVETFDPEYVTQYELGLKSTWFDDRLLINTATYFSDYTDIQFTAICLDCGSLIVIVDNAGEAEIKGVEVEMVANITPDFVVNGLVSYIDAEYTELNAGVQGITEDSEFPKTPEWTYSIGAQYTASLGESGSIVARSDWAYRSKTYHVVNNSPLLVQDSFGLLTARIAYIAPDERFEVALFGTNLTDEEYTTNGLESINFVGTADANPGRPREWGASLTYRFQ
jgi:iron complex outermembrane receptor protein